MTIIRRVAAFLLSLVLVTGSLGITAFAAEETMYGIGFVTASSLRLRAEANSSSAIADTASKNECVIVISKVGCWYKVIYNLQEGYMHENYLTVSTQENAELGYGVVTGNSVNLRSGPATSFPASAVSHKGSQLYVVGLNNGWYKVLYKDTFAYIRSDYLELTEIPYENKDSANSPKFFRHGNPIDAEPASDNSIQTEAVVISGDEILKESQKYLGIRYLSGGASPSGFDCAGLVYYVLNQLGYSAYRSPVEQYRHGTYVEKSDLKPGDLVFFAGTGANGISHVGIYSGNGRFIHAPNSRSTVSYSDLTTGYWANHYYGARRIA